jgi:hypothetical protein
VTGSLSGAAGPPGGGVTERGRGLGRGAGAHRLRVGRVGVPPWVGLAGILFLVAWWVGWGWWAWRRGRAAPPGGGGGPGWR